MMPLGFALEVIYDILLVELQLKKFPRNAKLFKQTKGKDCED